SQCASESDASVHQLRELLGDRQSDTRALDRTGLLPGALERLEDLVLLIQRDADAVIHDRDTNAMVAHARSKHGLTALASVFDRVRAIVHQNLLETRSIRHDHHRLRKWLDHELDFGALGHRSER